MPLTPSDRRSSQAPGVLPATLGRRARRVALLGSPNVGKSSIFNRLTGLRQRVSNYPGITVESVQGTARTPAGPVEVVDLPGTYSLLPRSPDERVARDELLGRVEGRSAPDLIVVVMDAANLERSLFLATQAMETGTPVILALNQVDLALQQGREVDAARLEELLGVPVVPTCGRTGAGCTELAEAIAAGGRRGTPPEVIFAEEVLHAAATLAERLTPFLGGDPPEVRLPTALCSAAAAEELLASLDASTEPAARGAAEALRVERRRLDAEGIDVETAAAEARYRAVEPIARAVLRDVGGRSPRRHRLDRVLTHPFWGTAVLLGVFTSLFMIIFSWAGPAIDLVDTVVADLGGWIGGLAGTGLLASFLENGVVAGLGAFLVFVPQIAALFLCIEALEDSGYLARAAFLLDRVMGRAGLPGRAFLPLLSGFACAIPGIMATRTIENRRERMITMAVLPLMSCSARLPVYAVVVGALFRESGLTGALVVLSMYLVGILLALVAARTLGRTLLRGRRTPLLLELPAYRWPSVGSVLRNTSRRTWSFVAGAGPIILTLTMVLWALMTFPGDVAYSRDYGAEIATALEREGASQVEGDEAGGPVAESDRLRALRTAERVSHSYMGRAGRVIEPVIRPLGFDWKIGVAVLASFAAREVFVPTLGVIYAVGEDAGEDDPGLLASMRSDRWPPTAEDPEGRPVFTPLSGISLLVFYVIALQCISTLAVIKRETRSWRWPLGLLGGYTALAYLASLLIYQAGSALGL